MGMSLYISFFPPSLVTADLLQKHSSNCQGNHVDFRFLFISPAHYTHDFHHCL
uniref:Uncharacterized protein n=1 Tax=Lepeophtheirus salmonis TaxID=72036 RepID=A0A0K2UQ47_LEPSM